MATVQRPHDADAREHRWPVMFGDQQPRLHGGLPLVGVVLCLGQFGDVFCGVAERDQLFAARQHDRIEKRLIPCHLDQSQRQLTRRTGVRLDELLNRWRQIIAREISAAPDVTRDILRHILIRHRFPEIAQSLQRQFGLPQLHGKIRLGSRALQPSASECASVAVSFARASTAVMAIGLKVVKNASITVDRIAATLRSVNLVIVESIHVVDPVRIVRGPLID
jgi:hypothetical protein